MKLKTMKLASEIKLEGVQAEVILSNGQLERVILRDENKNYVEFGCHQYAFECRVPAPPEKKEVVRLRGRLGEVIDFEEIFDDRFTAEQRWNKICDNLGISKQDSGLVLEEKVITLSDSNN